MGQKYKFESDQYIENIKIMKLNEIHKENSIDRKENISFQYSNALHNDVLINDRPHM